MELYVYNKCMKAEYLNHLYVCRSSIYTNLNRIDFKSLNETWFVWMACYFGSEDNIKYTKITQENTRIYVEKAV